MLRSQTTRLARYHQLVQVLASLARNSHEVEAVVQAVHQQAGTLFPSQITLLALQRPDGDWQWEMYEQQKRYSQHLPYYAAGIIESVLHGAALSVPDIYAHLREHPVLARRMLNSDEAILDISAEDKRPNQPVLSMLFAPLEVQGQRAGVLSIQSYDLGAFDETDLECLQLLAQHVSIALENAALREKLERLARTDALTGLPNRRAFYHDLPLCLKKVRQEDRELHLVMLDIHEFKRINDAHGHQIGDAVLATLGQTLAQVFPAPDAAFRLSGDEFALLVWGGVERLNELTARLTHQMRAANWPDGLGPICVQGGVAQPLPGADLDEWLSLADARMYQAKRRRAGSCQVDWGLDFGGLDLIHDRD